MRPTRADEYRHKAAECAESARLLSDPNAKRILMEIARKWLVMAERIEQNGPDWDAHNHRGFTSYGTTR